MDKMEELEALENKAKGKSKKQETPENTENVKSEAPNILDGYRKIDRAQIPQEELYPQSWEFAHRCPTSLEVANFSTIDENDQIAIIGAVEDLIRKCVIIYDTEKEQQVSAGQIIDGHRTFFLLLLREFFLPGKTIDYNTMCVDCKSPMKVSLVAASLRYKPLTKKFLECYDGRKAIITLNNQTIEFLVSTLEISSRIFRYVTKKYKEASKGDKNNNDSKEIFDKKFLLLAPYLFVTGHETMESIKAKFNEIQKNGDLLDAYVKVANEFKTDNYDTITFVHKDCGSEEEAQIKFPGGWKRMFTDENDIAELFG